MLDVESGEARIRSKIELVSDSVIMDQQSACAGIQSTSGITARSYFMLLWSKGFGGLEFWQGDGAAV